MPVIVICVATDLEGGELFGVGSVAGTSIEVIRTGVGPVNAALELTRYLARERVALVVSCGVGGAYPGSGLEPVDVVCAETEYYADLGAESPDGFLDMKAMGFTVVGEHFNRLPLDTFPSPRRVPFVTRSTCTGTSSGAHAIEQRSGGAVESMEGAAVVHTALAHELPVAEIRGISNPVGDRDRTGWRLSEAAAAARTMLLQWIEEEKHRFP